jgi:hypothetical protein
MQFRSKHTAEIEALLKQGDGFYLVVNCRTDPQHVIKLQWVESSEDLEKWKDLRFLARCDFCGTTQQYYARDVRGFEALPPDENFQTHPSFR